jgi:hypothetical protein
MGMPPFSMPTLRTAAATGRHRRDEAVIPPEFLVDLAVVHFSPRATCTSQADYMKFLLDAIQVDAIQA